METWFSAGFYFKKIEGQWFVLGATDLRFPDDVKPIGGCKKNESHPDETLKREMNEETKGLVSPLGFKQVHKEAHGEHTKYYYLVTEATQDLADPDEEIKIIEPDGQLLVVKYWRFEEFSKKVFRNHREGFNKAVVAMIMRDKTFPNA